MPPITFVSASEVPAGAGVLVVPVFKGPRLAGGQLVAVVLGGRKVGHQHPEVSLQVDQQGV